ncbi:uncharacterized protein CCOS01_11696 [Colletotrichum costaricense]|uniref:Uncharacterized protein n=1 Tax=Colletotrichum costaricense TaxID=1209916 RepID=A0AAI9YPT9_9PEZI|nr:uncharacterized protein CCOS01_11696 [Colletotrichum costaricense]KAK1518876.1 hypothetical protein CCOS01_11696 [Colletotrichum costaricense]
MAMDDDGPVSRFAPHRASSTTGGANIPATNSYQYET